VSASTQNQALSAVLFLCREVLGLKVEDLGLAARAKRGIQLPVVLSMPETTALLGAMSGTTWLMAALIYGGGLRVSECCELRIKDLISIRGSCSCETGRAARTDRRYWLNSGETSFADTRNAPRPYTAPTARRDSPACGCPTRWNGSTRTRAASSAGFGCFPAARCRLIRARASCGGITSATA
jgi:integrase